MATQHTMLDKFGYIHMKNLVSYMLTRNHESQTIAIDGNSNDIQSTGTKGVMLNGENLILPVDAAYDISAELPYAAWATATAYTTAGAVSEVTHIDPDGILRHYVCISAHTSGTYDDEPMVGAVWETYWRELKKWAVAAVADVITTGTDRDYLVCAMYDGTLRIFKAYNSAGSLQIPAYDPTRYVAVGLLNIANATGSAFTVGTTGLDTASVTDTFIQLTGTILPDVTLLDVN